MDAGEGFRSLDGYSSSNQLDLEERTPRREAGQPTKFLSYVSVWSPSSSISFGVYCRDANHAAGSLSLLKPPTLLLKH